MSQSPYGAKWSATPVPAGAGLPPKLGRNPLTGLSGLQPCGLSGAKKRRPASRNPLTGLSGLQLRAMADEEGWPDHGRNPLTGLSGLQLALEGMRDAIGPHALVAIPLRG